MTGGTGGVAANCIAKQPAGTPPALLAWDGDTISGGKRQSIFGGYGKFAESCEDAHAGNKSLKMLWTAPAIGNSYEGWIFDKPVDITGKTKLVFWLKAGPEKDRANNFFLALRSVGSGGEHNKEAGLGHVFSSPQSDRQNTGVAVQSFDNGQWHRVEYPVAKLCANDEHDMLLAYPCNNFDPTQVNEIVFGKFSVGPETFSFFLDEIGFE